MQKSFMTLKDKCGIYLSYPLFSPWQLLFFLLSPQLVFLECHMVRIMLLFWFATFCLQSKKFFWYACWPWFSSLVYWVFCFYSDKLILLFLNFKCLYVFWVTVLYHMYFLQALPFSGLFLSQRRPLYINKV